MIIRAAVAADASLLPAIERAAGEVFRTVPGLEWIADAGVMSEAAHARLIAAGTSWVADDDGLVGFLAAERFGDVLHIDELSVATGSHGRGIGRALIAAAADWGRNAGLHGVTLTTFRNVAWNAPYYARLGFVPSDDARLAADLARDAAAGLTGRCAMRLDL